MSRPARWYMKKSLAIVFSVPSVPTLSSSGTWSMWLLNTQTYRLYDTDRPPARYAILSHVWGSDEESFVNVTTRGLRRQPGSKAYLACKCAAAEGFDWLWIDTCCIDKTNSTELSEAINSMYRWYASATVCYAYLADVSSSPSDTLDKFWESFRKSKWHTRGWTLQELLASQKVIFLTSEWMYIGTKVSLAPLLQTITGINVSVLTFQTSLSDVPVSTRMTWASRRKTTRLEDEAYCLMGIFDVNIPVIYGEGERAFRRLQEEIIRTSFDHTLFTWGVAPLLGTDVAVMCSLEAPTTDDVGETDLLASSTRAFRASSQHSQNHAVQVLSYLAFTEALKSTLAPDGDEISHALHSQEDLTLPEFTATTYGVRAHLPIIPLPNSDLLCLALLACRMEGSPESICIGLLLGRAPGAHAFDVGAWTNATPKAKYAYVRYVNVTQDVLNWLRTSSKKHDVFHHWKTVYISQRYRTSTDLRPGRMSLIVGSTVHILVPSYVEQTLHGTLRDLSGHDRVIAAYGNRPLFRTIQRGEMLAYQSYLYQAQDEGDAGTEFRIYLGVCHEFWATVSFHTVRELSRNSDADIHAPPGGWHKDILQECTHCAGSHCLSHWSADTPLEEHWELDHPGLSWQQWERFRTFEHAGTRVNVRFTRETQGHHMQSPLWLMAVEVDYAQQPETQSLNVSQSSAGRRSGPMRRLAAKVFGRS